MNMFMIHNIIYLIFNTNQCWTMWCICVCVCVRCICVSDAFMCVMYLCVWCICHCVCVCDVFLGVLCMCVIYLSVCTCVTANSSVLILSTWPEHAHLVVDVFKVQHRPGIINMNGYWPPPPTPPPVNLSLKCWESSSVLTVNIATLNTWWQHVTTTGC